MHSLLKESLCRLLSIVTELAPLGIWNNEGVVLPTPARERLLKLPLDLLPARYANAAAKRLGVDLRLLWDTSAHRDAGILLLKGDASSAEALLRSWYSRGSEVRGWRWGCPMVSAFRLAVLTLLAAYRQVEGDWIEREYRFIERHLERGSDNNHYFFNVIGILVADALLGRSDSVALGRPSSDELIRLLDRYFLPDGVWFEASSAYHFLCCEGLGLAALVNRDVHNACLMRKGTMDSALAFMDATLAADGSSLQIGDDDSASCFLPSGAPGNRLFQRNFFARALRLQAPLQKAPTTVFKSFGLVIHQCGSGRVACYGVPNGQHGKGGHAHNDKLSVAIEAGGAWIATDPGSFSYTRDRNTSRSVESHGTISILGEEPCPLNLGRFVLPEVGGTDIYHGSHGWVVRTRYGQTNLSRSLVSDKDRIVITDCAQPFPSRAIRSRLVMSSGTVARVNGRAGFTLEGRRGGRACVEFGQESKIEIKPILISPSYGSRMSSNIISWEWPAHSDVFVWSVRIYE